MKSKWRYMTWSEWKAYMFTFKYPKAFWLLLIAILAMFIPISMGG